VLPLPCRSARTPVPPPHCRPTRTPGIVTDAMYCGDGSSAPHAALRSPRGQGRVAPRTYVCSARAAHAHEKAEVAGARCYTTAPLRTSRDGGRVLDDAFYLTARVSKKFMPVRWTGIKAGWSVTRRNVGSEIQNSRLARSAHYDRKTAPEAKQRHAGKAHGDVPVDESMCKSPMSLSC
jgi:hypothetical protein